LTVKLGGNRRVVARRNGKVASTGSTKKLVGKKKGQEGGGNGSFIKPTTFSQVGTDLEE